MAPRAGAQGNKPSWHFKYGLALRRLTLYRHAALSLVNVFKIFTLISVLVLLIYLVCVLFCSVNTLSYSLETGSFSEPKP